MREKQANRRIRVLLGIFALVFVGVLGRAVWLQGVEAAHLGGMAQAQHRETRTLPAGRGTIFDRNGVQFAIGEQMTTIYADPEEVTQPRAIAVAAQRLLGVDPDQLYTSLLARHTSFMYLQRFADPAAAAKFLHRGFVGIYSYPEEKRTYPQGSVAAQVIGFAGTDEKGLSGLEFEYERQLAGRTGTQTFVKDPFGRTLDTLNLTPARQGQPIYTTIDHTIQAQAESVLRQTVAKWHAKDAVAIVEDPTTGDILAMAQGPSYNANNAAKVAQAVQTNRAVTDTYEPGSTFKLVTIAGALSQGIVTPQTTFPLPYSILVADRTIHDAEPRPSETLSVSQILQQSSNVGAITIAQHLGGADLMTWIGRFGFGKTTGLDFPGESAGQVLPLSQWSGSTIGNVPIGQGIAVTPIQMAAAYAAIANGGIWIQPHLVDRIGGHATAAPAHRRIVSPAIDAELKQMLTGVVDEHNATGTQAAIPGYSVAGKTGTAQEPTPTGYSDTKYVASFVGMVPVDKPRLLVLVVVTEPKGDIYGGDVAAPAFAQIAKFDLQWLAVPPDQPQTLNP